MSNTDEKAGATPRTDEVHGRCVQTQDSIWDDFATMTVHANTLERELAEAKADALQQFRNCAAEYELRKAAEQLVAVKTDECARG